MTDQTQSGPSGSYDLLQLPRPGPLKRHQRKNHCAAADATGWCLCHGQPDKWNETLGRSCLGTTAEEFVATFLTDSF